MTRSEALADAVRRLTTAGIETPSRDARALLVYSENIEPNDLVAGSNEPLTRGLVFESAISRRLAREPVSKIVGYRDFWNHRFLVTPDVLDPRPDTETLIEAVLDDIDRSGSPHILDLGTGSGCILLSLLSELPSARGVGSDQSSAAIEVAKRNAAILNLTYRTNFLVNDWFEGLDDTFDLVVCNPPYISITERQTLSPEVIDWDPEAALFAGMDGLQAYRKIANGLAAVLRPNGKAFFEIGIGQETSVADLLNEAGFLRITSRCDLGGRVRCLIVQR